MNKQKFDSLLDNYLLDDISAADRRLVEQWFELIDKNPMESSDWEATKALMWQKIKQQTNDNSSFFKISKKYWLAAAAAVVLLACGYYLLNNSEQYTPTITLTKTADKEGVTWSNSSQEPKIVTLTDGSHVRLQPKAKIRISTDFSSKNREVMLEGDAFFSVAHDPAHPFVVSIDNMITKVIGTSFWIYKRADQSIEVAVKTGKVAVSKKPAKDDTKNSNGVLLTPNLKATYFVDNQLFVTGLVEKPEIIKEQNEAPNVSFNFDNTTLESVLNVLEKAYGIPFVIENESLKKCTITGNLDNLEMFDKLNILTQTLNISYEVKGTSILISGKGCGA